MALPRKPVKYSEEVADKVCEYLAEGYSLREIEKIQGMPTKKSILEWAKDKSDFRDHYARACEIGCDTIADEIIEIADDIKGDVNRDRLRVDARKWALAKKYPKKYGDRIHVDTNESKPKELILVTEKSNE